MARRLVSGAKEATAGLRIAQKSLLKKRVRCCDRVARSALMAAGSPLRRRPKAWLDELRDLAFGREAVELRLAENFPPVDGDLETSVAAGLELDACKHRRPAVEELLSQAHGLVEIVSRDAEFDRDLWFWSCHQSLNLFVHIRTYPCKELFPMSKEGQAAILVVACACGILMRGTVEELVPMVQKHARESHNMEVTRENVLSRARPEA
jgi:predicted small metal-binding protein